MNNKRLIEELNLLWDPVQPYLVKEIKELYSRRDGNILEIGPFAGLIFTLAEENIGENFTIASFPKEAIPLFKSEAIRLGLQDRVRIIETDPSLRGVPDGSIDLAIFRGALFFPTLFRIEFSAIYRVLHERGRAFVGGGFGKYTPPEIIDQIGKRSEQLNLEMGKVRMEIDEVRDLVKAEVPEKTFEITTEGGLWVLIRK